MTQITAVIVYESEDQLALEGAKTQITEMIDQWPETIVVSGATLTDDAGNIEGLPTDVAPPAPANQEAPSAVEEAPSSEEEAPPAEGDPNTDPALATPTGNEF